MGAGPLCHGLALRAAKRTPASLPHFETAFAKPSTSVVLHLNNGKIACGTQALARSLLGPRDSRCIQRKAWSACGTVPLVSALRSSALATARVLTCSMLTKRIRSTHLENAASDKLLLPNGPRVRQHLEP